MVGRRKSALIVIPSQPATAGAARNLQLAFFFRRIQIPHRFASRNSSCIVFCSTLLILAAALPPASRAQEAPPAPIHWTAALSSAAHALQSGQKVTVALTGDIDAGWHVYAFPQPPDSPIIATQVTVPEGQPLSLSGEIAPPKAESLMDPTTGKETSVYTNSVTINLPLQVAHKAHAGKQDLEMDVRYQACNNRLCLPPRTDKVTLPVEISSHR